MSVTVFMRRIAAAAAFFCAASQPSLGETFEARMAPCLACHGENGNSPHDAVPSLGGQPAPYLLIQLYLFRENQRASTYKKDDQMIEIMSEMTKGFTDDDLRKFSEFLSKLPPPPRPLPQQAGDPARMRAGSELITQHRCNSCHNLDLTGRESIPHIANQ